MQSKTIGQRLRRLREDVGQSKTYVARQLGISYSAMCCYEYGTHIPRDDMKIALANYYGTTVEKLFFAEEENET